MPSLSPISPLSPVSPMSPAKTSARPPHLVLNQYSSSLSGMEIAVPSPLTPGFRDYVSSRSKALPPTPRKAYVLCSPHSVPTSRKPSSTSITYAKEERPRTPGFFLQDEALSSNTFLAPPEARSSTSILPGNVTLRPQLTRDAQTLGACDFGALKQSSGNSIFSEWKAPKYEYSEDEYGSSLPASGRAFSPESWVSSERTQNAEERARDYKSVLPDPPSPESGFLPFEMSARITDVSDGSLMPAPLVLSNNSEDRKLSSQFSSCDSDTDSLYEESKPSLKSRAKKAFHSRKASQERREKAHADLKVLQHSQAVELATAKRASLQNGIDEMYNTLTGLYSPAKPKGKHDSTNSKSTAVAGDLRCAATPVAADPKFGKKAWDSPKSSKNPAPKKEDDSVGKKLASVFQNGAMAVGLDRGKEQKLRNGEWRSELKRKIVLVRPQGQF